MTALPRFVDDLSPQDIEAVAAIDAEAFAPVEGPERTAKVRAMALRDELAHPWARIWVVREGARPVAFLVAWHVVDELHILNVATAPSEQRRGHGHLLLERALAYARERKVRMLLLEVRRSNGPALALYRRHQFFVMGIRARYYRDGEDALEMALLLDKETGAVLPRADEVSLE